MDSTVKRIMESRKALTTNGGEQFLLSSSNNKRSPRRNKPSRPSTSNQISENVANAASVIQTFNEVFLEGDSTPQVATASEAALPIEHHTLDQPTVIHDNPDTLEISLPPIPGSYFELPQTDIPLGPLRELTVESQDLRVDSSHPAHMRRTKILVHFSPEASGYSVSTEEFVRSLQQSVGRINGCAMASIKIDGFLCCFARINEDGTPEQSEGAPESLQVPSEQKLVIVLEHSTPRPPILSNNLAQHPSIDYERTVSWLESAAATLERGVDPCLSTPPDRVASPATMVSAFSDASKEKEDSRNVHKRPAPESDPDFGRPTKRPTYMQHLPMTSVDHSPQPAPTDSSHSPPSSAQSQTFPPRISEPQRTWLPASYAPPPHIPVMPSPVPISSPKTKEDFDAQIEAYLRAKIQAKPGYAEFAKSKGKVGHSIPDVIRQYRFAKEVVEEFNNCWPTGIPEFHRKIHKKNIWHALDRQTSWGSECMKTLELVEKYGPGGTEYENPKVVALMQEGGVTEGSEKVGLGAVAFIVMLKSIHKEWTEKSKKT